VDEPVLTLTQALDRFVIEREDDGEYVLVDTDDDAVVGSSSQEQVVQIGHLRAAQNHSSCSFDLGVRPKVVWSTRPQWWRDEEVLGHLDAAWRGLGPGASVEVMSRSGTALSVEVFVDLFQLELFFHRDSSRTLWQLRELEEGRQTRLAFDDRSRILAAVDRFDHLVSSGETSMLYLPVDDVVGDVWGYYDRVRWWHRCAVTRRSDEPQDLDGLLRTVDRTVRFCQREAAGVDRIGDRLLVELLDAVLGGAGDDLLDDLVAGYATEAVSSHPVVLVT